MSAAVVVLAVVLLAIMEKYWTPAALKSLRFHGSCDHVMAEPGELITWSGAVENHMRLPVPFVRLREQFPVHAQRQEDPSRSGDHCRQGISQWSVEEKMSLRSGQRCIRKVHFTISRRGQYQIGNYQLSAGDLLGFHEEYRHGSGQTIVIIPERARSRTALNALGGFLGDISVRRFILEDPVLTVGYLDYTGREPMKSICWTRTAAAGTLQVRQYDHTAEQTVSVLLNVEGGTPEELEGCFRLMRSACELLERNKIPFGIRTNGNLPGPVGSFFCLSDGLGARHLDTILYALGRADYTCYHSFAYLANQALLHRKSNESYIVITPAFTAQAKAAIQMLESGAGTPICVLTGNTEGAGS